jgi:coproporphyrinogen III oxidase-like Fe-S oxidoreductase
MELKKPYNFMYSVFGKMQYSKINWKDLAPFHKNEVLLKYIMELEEEGLVLRNKVGFSLTKKGIFWGNNIGQELATVLLDLTRNNKGV